MFSVRILTIDSYLAHARPDLDNAAHADARVPILRIFGTHEDGHRICMHIHGILPYCYIDYGPSGTPEGVIDTLNAKGWKVHSAETVAMHPMYGFAPHKRKYLLTRFYSPGHIRDLLQSGTMKVCDAHIPYTLQFLIDYAYTGCGIISLPQASVLYRETSLVDVPVQYRQSSSIKRTTHANIIEVDVCGSDLAKGSFLFDRGKIDIRGSQSNSVAQDVASSPQGFPLDQLYREQIARIYDRRPGATPLPSDSQMAHILDQLDGPNLDPRKVPAGSVAEATFHPSAAASVLADVDVGDIVLVRAKRKETWTGLVVCLEGSRVQLRWFFSPEELHVRAAANLKDQEKLFSDLMDWNDRKCIVGRVSRDTFAVTVTESDGLQSLVHSEGASHGIERQKHVCFRWYDSKTKKIRSLREDQLKMLVRYVYQPAPPPPPSVIVEATSSNSHQSEGVVPIGSAPVPVAPTSSNSSGSSFIDTNMFRFRTKAPKLTQLSRIPRMYTEPHLEPTVEELPEFRPSSSLIPFGDWLAVKKKASVALHGRSLVWRFTRKAPLHSEVAPVREDLHSASSSLESQERMDTYGRIVNFRGTALNDSAGRATNDVDKRLENEDQVIEEINSPKYDESHRFVEMDRKATLADLLHLSFDDVLTRNRVHTTNTADSSEYSMRLRSVVIDHVLDHNGQLCYVGILEVDEDRSATKFYSSQGYDCREFLYRKICEDIDPDLIMAFDLERLARAIRDLDLGRTIPGVGPNLGRVFMNLHRICRSELKLSNYALDKIILQVLNTPFPLIPDLELAAMLPSPNAVSYISKRLALLYEVVKRLEVVPRTIELSKVIGIDFSSVLTRGSQFRVESMMIRLGKMQDFVFLSPNKQQVADQPAMECLPLVMEPQSKMYVDPVIVFDFQSLYPSMMIAYNICFSTCLGRICAPSDGLSEDQPMIKRLGVDANYEEPPAKLIAELHRHNLLTVSPNGVMFAKNAYRQGVLPGMLSSILEQRVRAKQQLKRGGISAHQKRELNARQFALKMIANVTYGYTSASFSGRMPCAEVADAIVQFGRETLESAIRTIEASEFDGRKPQVIYGDTDSLFVRCPGFSREEAFQVGKHLSSVITAQHPYPVKLAFEKVFHPCVLVTKKRYVGYSWESPDQKKPIFLAKGIESVRRDACPLVQETLDECLHSIFVNRSLTELKANLEAKFFAFARDPESFLDKCVVAKEVRPHYKDDRLLPPAAVVAGRLRCDPTYSARSGDRTPYLILERQSDLGEKLNERAVHPIEYVNYALGSGVGLPRIDVEYYLSRQVVPSLDRILGLAGFSVKAWYEASIRHRINRTLARPRRDVNNGNQHHIDRYLTSHGISLAGSDEAARDIVQHSSIEQSTRAVCLVCAGGQAEEESCISVNCPVWWVRSVHRVALNAWDASLLEW